MTRNSADRSLVALLNIARGSVRALRAAVADLSFAPDSVRRVSDEAETLSAAMGRLDRMLASMPASAARAATAAPPSLGDGIAIADVMLLLDLMRRLQDVVGQCRKCGGATPS